MLEEYSLSLAKNTDDKWPTEKIRVLQCGFPKSGNYGFYRAIRLVMDEKGLFVSYKQASGLSQIIERLCEGYVFVPDMDMVDSFYCRDGRFVLEFPHPSCRFVDVDGQMLLSVSTFLWTHEKAEIVRNRLLKNITHRFYVLRDGRDVVNSMAHHVTRPQMLAVRPEYRYSSAEEVYRDMELFRHYVREWRDHVRSYLANRDYFVCLKLEELIDRPSMMVEKIASSLCVDVDTEKLAEKITFKNLSKTAPGHLRRGKNGDWRNYFTEKHKEAFKEIAGRELIELGYEEDTEW